MSYRRTRRADNDLEDIYVYGAGAFGALQADRYLRELERVFERLAAYPRSARERNEFDPPLRLMPYGSHLVVYMIVADEDVLIIRVLHARRNWQNLLS